MARRDIDKAPRQKKIVGYRVPPGPTILEAIEQDLRDTVVKYNRTVEKLRVPGAEGDLTLLNKKNTARGMIRAYATCIEHHTGPHTDKLDTIMSIEKRFMKGNG